ncbi:hypothetical protein [Haloterrigena alkaliphila]|uniref:Uncharacterized protein n=1 Tax=Haloterrigena alkaliphila TaxID=2816475 RepID=A0A8A2V8E5_9EURY|nr:hypothetical protein [Haloterrigena alkaliphila]QSW98163.1 hypothetical protein J0X25_12160 [Haloterrigena alkaliphila]
MSTQSSGESAALERSVKNPNSNCEYAIKTRPAVQYVLAKSSDNYVSERRVQAILFSAEVNWQSNNDYSLLDATFEKIRRGVYSKEIRKAFQSLGLRSRRAYHDGYQTRKFDTRPVDTPDQNEVDGKEVEEAFDMLDAVLDDVRDVPEDDIMGWCLNLEDVRSLNSGTVITLDSLSA